MDKMHAKPSLIMHAHIQHRTELLINIPGHWAKLQVLVSLDNPMQSRPLFLGAGLLHSLSLMVLPLPHVLSHGCHGDQGPQPPSTVYKH